MKIMFSPDELLDIYGLVLFEKIEVERKLEHRDDYQLCAVECLEDKYHSLCRICDKLRSALAHNMDD